MDFSLSAIAVECALERGYVIYFFPAHSKYGIAVTVLTFPDNILGDPGADKGGEGKSKRAGKYIWNEEK